MCPLLRLIVLVLKSDYDRIEICECGGSIKIKRALKSDYDRIEIFFSSSKCHPRKALKSDYDRIEIRKEGDQYTV